MRRKKSPLRTHYSSAVYTAPPPKRTRQVGSNTNSKGYMMTSKETVCIIGATTQKANQIKYNEVSISYLYLIN